MDLKKIFDVSQKTVLVTGAAGLIGSNLVASLLENGAKVLAGDLNLELLQKHSSEHWKNTENLFFASLDITSDESIDQFLKDGVAKLGNINCLVNNAAIDAKFDANQSKLNLSRFENYPFDLIQKSVEVNLLGTVKITQKLCKHMVDNKQGNIINIASTYSLVAPNQALYDFGTGDIKYKPVDYVASKSFVPNFSRYLSTFYAREHIRCNTLVPHGINNGHDEKFLNNWNNHSPMARMCEVSELDGPFLFLISDASSYMTGSTLVYDGGWTAW